jgi:hypothetical protein
MATPLRTVPTWVPNKMNPEILIITENYPKDPDDRLNNTYFYRSLNTQIKCNGANNLLNNICKAFKIEAITEAERLNIFLNEKNYFLIDTFPSKNAMSDSLIKTTLKDQNWIDAIIDDILYINPQKILFTCVGSNGKLLPVLERSAEARGLNIFERVIINPTKSNNNNNKLFHSPSNRAFPTFKLQIDELTYNSI